MKVLVVEPNKVPYLKDIDGSLESLQNEVGGLIQVVYPYEDKVGIICNDEGKLMGLTLNRYIEENEDVIAGTFLICGLGEEDFTDISKELAEKYYDKFKMPESFGYYKGRLVITRANIPECSLGLKEYGVMRKWGSSNDLLDDKKFNKITTEPIMLCDENQEEEHKKELDMIFENLLKLNTSNKSLVLKASFEDIVRKDKADVYYQLSGYDDLYKFMEGIDMKNGCDIGISDDGGIAIAVYGSGYDWKEYIDVHKLLVIVHQCNNDIDGFKEIMKSDYDGMDKINMTKELCQLRSSVRKIARKRSQEKNGRGL